MYGWEHKNIGFSDDVSLMDLLRIFLLEDSSVNKPTLSKVTVKTCIKLKSCEHF